MQPPKKMIVVGGRRWPTSLLSAPQANQGAVKIAVKSIDMVRSPVCAPSVAGLSRAVQLVIVAVGLSRPESSWKR